VLSKSVPPPLLSDQPLSLLLLLLASCHPVSAGALLASCQPLSGAGALFQPDWSAG